MIIIFDYFRDKILIPMSDGSLSKSQLEKRKVTLTDDYIKEAMKGNKP